MKNKILIRLTSLLVAISLFAACEPTAMEKAQDAYDASMVVPAVLSTAGPSLVLQTFTYDFGVSYFRAGSTWNWTATDATVQSVSPDTRTATIQFNTLPASGKAYVNVTETTVGGKTSDPKAIEVTVKPFCPVVRADLIGTWDIVETGDKPRTTTVEVAEGAEDDQIVVKVGAEGIPGLLGQVFIDWGEAFQATVEPYGDITLTLNLNDGTVSVPFTYWGQTVPGPWDYWYFGSGTWDGCGATPKITLDLNLDYDGDAPGVAQYTNTVVMTKQE
ncbi:MAG: hypothetical protein RBS38_11830 [Bacteroidales bacterium]|jgi:hypothetical protein|nr:hypothetical protein [Bacteroidales bacterium]